MYTYTHKCQKYGYLQSLGGPDSLESLLKRPTMGALGIPQQLYRTCIKVAHRVTPGIPPLYCEYKFMFICLYVCIYIYIYIYL